MCSTELSGLIVLNCILTPPHPHSCRFAGTFTICTVLCLDMFLSLIRSPHCSLLSFPLLHSLFLGVLLLSAFAGLPGLFPLLSCLYVFSEVTLHGPLCHLYSIPWYWVVLSLFSLDLLHQYVVSLSFVICYVTLDPLYQCSEQIPCRVALTRWDELTGI